ncbi:unnamed protein product [Durusdinium trenchii]|uniref:Apple domain-containing protein n=1 Tax=Durusdinium trenchii TaxID=1381693 RepID=A0ABP0MX24_9DINO
MGQWMLIGLLAFCLASASARAPIASGVCPKGYFRNATVLFPCDQHSGVAFAPVSKTEDVTIRVPTGVQDLKLLVRAQFAMMIAFRDPLDNKQIPFVKDGEKTQAWRDLSLQLDAGQVLSQQTGMWEGNWRVGLNYIGTSQEELDVIVRGVPEGGTHELVNISFSYTAYHGCTKPSVPKGCADFARFASRQLVFNWSSWVQEKFPTADAAWSELCDKTMEKVTPLQAGPVPYYMFGEVWGKWPLANLVHPGWREAFRFFDTLGGTPPDGYVEPLEFRTGYGLASTYLSMFGWCEILRKQYLTWEEAWKALSGAEFGFESPVNFEKWKTSFWDTYKPEEGMSKATADESFVYADADGNEEVSQKEFASIYFSCAPENQGKPPGGQAAQAEKEEETAAEAATKEKLPETDDAVSRCLYENIEYSGSEAGAILHTPNLTECQVRLTLQDLGDLAKLEKEKDILQVEIATELAKSAKIPVHDIRDMAGQVGKVTLSADASASGKLFMDSFVDMPAGSKLQDMQKVAAQSEANRKLREALQADTASSDAQMEVLVEAIPFAQCFVMGTKFEPNMADLATALTARACQNMCQRTAGCAFFSYLQDSQQCGLHVASAKPIFFESAMAGPQECQGLPSVYEPSADEMEVAGAGGSMLSNPWFWIALIVLSAILVALACWLRKSAVCAKKTKRRQVSRQGVDGKLGPGEHRYMPLPADQQLEQDMLAQAASDATWQQVALQGPSQPSQVPTPDFSPMSGRWNGSASYGSHAGSQWQPMPLPSGNMSAPMTDQAWQFSNPSGTQGQPDWMPHFLGAEAVREYDMWRSQRPERSSWPLQQMPPMFPMPAPPQSDIPYAYSLPAQAGRLGTNLGDTDSLRYDPRIT